MTRLPRAGVIAAGVVALVATICTPAAATSTAGTDTRTVSPRILSSDSPYYQKLPSNTPRASDSAGLVSSLVSQAHKYYGTAAEANVSINTTRYTPPLYVARTSDPAYDITAWNCQNKPGTTWYTELNRQLRGIRVPADAQADPSDDGSMAIYNPDTNELVELWKARKVNGAWQACWGGKLNPAAQSLGVFPQNYGVSAGGLTMWAGTIRQQELLDGHIDHVMALAIPLTKKGTFSWPANRSDGWVSGTQLAIGQMLRLPASLDIDSMKLSPVARTIAKAAQEYGIIVTDTSGSVQFAAENVIGLADNKYPSLFRGRWSSQEMTGKTSAGEVPFPLEKLVALPLDYQVPASIAASIPPEPAATPNTAYAKAVKKAKPYLYWRLSESGITAADSSGHKRTGMLRNTAQVAGALAGNPAVATNGNTATTAYAKKKVTPRTSTTVQVWFRTESTTGGKIAGFENTRVGNGTRYDRSLYLTDDGLLAFGTYLNQVNLAVSSRPYNDGAWHMATASQGGSGIRLYVDGVLVATNSATRAESFSGYWRLAGGNLTGWPSAPKNYYFAGSVDEFAIYSYALGARTIAAQYKAAARS